MKKMLSLIIICIIACCSYGQSPEFKDFLKANGYSGYGALACKNYYRVEKTGYWGIANEAKLKTVLPCQYSYIRSLCQSCMYEVGIIRNGTDTLKKLFSIEQEAIVVPDFKKKWCFVKDSMIIVGYKSGKRAMVSITGRCLFDNFDNAVVWGGRLFQQGNVLIRNNGKTRIGDRNGKFTGEEYDSVYINYKYYGGNTSGIFVNNAAIVFRGGRAALLKSSGVLATGFIYSSLYFPYYAEFDKDKLKTGSERIDDCLIAVKDGKTGLIKPDGTELCALKYEGIYVMNGNSKPTNGFDIKGYAWARLNGKYCLIDKSGRELTPFIYTIVDYFTEDFAPVAKTEGQDTLYGFIDRNGREICPFIYRKTYDFGEGMAVVADKNMKYGYIDKAGKEIVSPKYDLAYSFIEGRGMVANKVKGELFIGFCNKSGDLVIPLIYSKAGFFSEGLAAVMDKKSKKCGYIDTNGNVVIPFRYDAGGQFKNGVATVEKGGKLLEIDKTGKPTDY